MAAIPVIDESLLDRVHRVASPAFPVSPPIRHAPTARTPRAPHVLEPLWNAGIVSAHAIDFYRLRNVFVTATGLVFDEQARLFRSSIGYSAEADVKAALWSVQRLRGMGTPPVESSPAILCTQPARHPVFHWLTLGLPRAMLARQELAISGPRYVMAHAPEPLRATIHDSLNLAGIATADIVEIEGAPRFFAELFVIDGIASPDLYISPLAARCLETLMAPIPPARAERLFILPSPLACHRLARADSLAGIAAQAGYAVIDLAAMRLPQQIGLFKGASHAAGLGGAELAHALFMPPGSHIGALMPAGSIDNGGWLISQIKRHHYAEWLSGTAPPVEQPLSPASQQRRVVAISDAAFRRFLRGL